MDLSKVANFSTARRGIALGLAIALAAVATISLFSYLRGVEARALKGVESVQAFVAKEIIPSGTSGGTAITKGLIGRELIPRKSLALGSIRSLTEIQSRVASVTILKGEQILSARFKAASAAKGLLNLPADRQALSVELELPPGVSGFVRSGDHISVIARLEKTGPTANPVEVQVKYLLQDIEVLQVGQRVVTTDKDKGAQVEQNTRKVLLTLALTPGEAEKLAFALFDGELYFTLLPEGQKPVETPGRTRENAFQ